MPKPRASRLESATARRKLAVAKRPYWVMVSPGIALGYRRNEGPGTWSVRVTHGAQWVKRIGLADDYEAADGKAVLTYWQAIDAARALARRQPNEAVDTKPLTLDEALDHYERDLVARGGDPYNARRARLHLPAALLSKPVALLSAAELKRWRDGLAEKVAPATVNRTRTCVKAACEWALRHDPRIESKRPWKVGLDGLPDTQRARNVILDDATVVRIVAAAHARDPAFGLMVEVAAVTGARLSQIGRLEVGDLQVDRLRLMMPRSAKGRIRTKKHERRAVAIPSSLVAMLQQAGAGRPAEAPLLLRPNGEPWQRGRNHDYRKDFRAVAVACGLDPGEVTLYALRHSSIVRQLLANVPIRVIAASHDTSVGQIEKNYSPHIGEHSDALSRAALLDIRSNVVVSLVRQA
jgi:integrase